MGVVWRPMRCFLPTACLLGAVLAVTGCGDKDKESAPGLDATVAARHGRPPPAPPGSPHWIHLELRGGRFGAGEKLELAFAPSASCRLEPTPTGFRLAVADPAAVGNLSAPGWGLWLFVDGEIADDRSLACRTGTQITLDSIPLAPATDPGRPATRASHPVMARLTIEVVDRERGYFEATLAGTFLAPDGKDPVEVAGTLRLPLPGM